MTIFNSAVGPGLWGSSLTLTFRTTKCLRVSIYLVVQNTVLRQGPTDLTLLSTEPSPTLPVFLEFGSKIRMCRCYWLSRSAVKAPMLLLYLHSTSHFFSHLLQLPILVAIIPWRFAAYLVFQTSSLPNFTGTIKEGKWHPLHVWLCVRRVQGS